MSIIRLSGLERHVVGVRLGTRFTFEFQPHRTTNQTSRYTFATPEEGTIKLKNETTRSEAPIRNCEKHRNQMLKDDLASIQTWLTEPLA